MDVKNNTVDVQVIDKKTTSKNHPIQLRISRLLQQLGAGMHEREQILAIALLGAIAGHNTFLYGPPGTAKSLISRRLAAAFEHPKYFEYLMNRFSTPEEVFGPVSIKELKEDRYIRQIDGYLPTADFAFLDEIWKSSPAILNSLLTIINEHIFKNGSERVLVPLKSLICASNEVPAENQGLDALFDRFIIRLQVPPISLEDNFTRLINSKPSSDKPVIAPELLISYTELSEWREQLHNIQLSADTLLVIKSIRQQLTERFDELQVYVSDRRWQRAAMLLKASAFCNGRNETNHSDTLLLKHCLWTTPGNLLSLHALVDKTIESCGFETEISVSELDIEKDALDKEINFELFHSEDIYKTEVLKDGKTYFRVSARFKVQSSSFASSDDIRTVFVPFAKFKTIGKFYPVDASGNEIRSVECSFDGQGICQFKHQKNYYHDYSYEPTILIHRGAKKQDVNTRLIQSLATSVKDIRSKLAGILTDLEQKYVQFKNELASPFVTDKETDIAVKGVIMQIGQLKLRIADCVRLESLCNQP